MSKIFKCDYCGKDLVRGNTDKSEHHFCNKECKGMWQKKQREDLGYTKEWLYEQYVIKGRDANDIAKEVGRNSKRVWEWLKDYGIETRRRGYGDQRVWFKKGEPNGRSGVPLAEETKQKIRQKCLEDGRVPYLVNGKHWLKQEGKHPATWKGGISPERQTIYASEKWKEAVKTVWKRDNATCQLCGKRQNEVKNEKFHIHHLYSFADYPYLRTNPDNLVLLCKKCHLFVHSNANTNNEFMLKKAELPEWLKEKEK